MSENNEVEETVEQVLDAIKESVEHGKGAEILLAIFAIIVVITIVYFIL